MEEVQIREENRKLYVEAKIAEAEFEKDSDYIELFASLVSSHREPVDERKETWVDNMTKFETVTKATAYTSVD